jgi:outer membrane protein assembly factor BamE (lipoprotein component of BamABCDE complex)
MKINYKINITLILCFFLFSCSLKPASYKSGVTNIEIKQELLIPGKSNKNDVIKYMGETVLIDYLDKSWIYTETLDTKNYLGKKVRLKNNILILTFDNKGILLKKDFFDIKDFKDMEFDDLKTETYGVTSSFSKKIFSSMKKRMNSKNDNK